MLFEKNAPSTSFLKGWSRKISNGKALKRSCTMYEKKRSPRVKSDGPDLHAENPRVSELIQEFKDVFREDLPQELPPNREVDHVIETGDNAPVNVNVYPLLIQQL